MYTAAIPMVAATAAGKVNQRVVRGAARSNGSMSFRTLGDLRLRRARACAARTEGGQAICTRSEAAKVPSSTVRAVHPGEPMGTLRRSDDAGVAQASAEPAARASAAVVRTRILADHAELRARLSEASALATRVLGTEPGLEERLRRSVLEM